VQSSLQNADGTLIGYSANVTFITEISK